MCLDIWFVVRVRIAAEKWLEGGWWSGGRSHGVLLMGGERHAPFVEIGLGLVPLTAY